MSKTKDMKSFDFGISTHTGLVRQENEDYSACFECINGDVFIVCDGMGGHAGGATASQLATESIRAYLENHYFDMPEDALKAAIEFANSVVYKKSKANTDYSGMATAIVMAMVRYDKVHYAHAGDSRMYFFTENNFRRLTRDHSHAQSMIEKGEITELEAKNHPARFELSRVLGISPNIEIEICSSPTFPALNDYVLLCSDGLTGMLSDVEISVVLQENLTVQEKTDKLIQLANEKGGTDNITVQLLYFNNVANKKSKFSFPALAKESSYNVTETKPETAETIEEVEPQPAELIEETELNITESVEETEPQFSEQAAPPQPIITNPVMKENEPKAAETVKENNKENILKHFEFIEKLKEKPDLKHKIRIAAIILGVLFLAFVVWDLFIKQSASTKISNTPNQTVDTLQNKEKDTVAQQNQLPAKPDTIWINYSIKKGDLLGKISSKFGIPLSFIIEKNKLTSDMIAEKQKLEIPTKANHTVLPNETLAAIAKKYQVDKNSILKANDIKDEKNIKAGKDLIIPFK